MVKVVKTIKVADDVYRMLNIYAGSLRERENRHVSISDTINFILTKKEKTDIMEAAGKWKMTKKDADNLIEHIMEHRHSWKPRY